MSALGRKQPTPDIVRAVEERVRRLGFEKSCRPETGRLLQTLVASIPNGRLAEFGCGAGYGTAWMVAGLQPAARLVTVEADAGLAESTRASFGEFPQVSVIHGDWRELLEHAPFSFAFVDVKSAKLEYADLVIEALAPGGVALIDDLTPFELWPEEWRGKPDELRERWLLDDRLHAVEVRVAFDHAAIIATRKAL